MKKYITISLLVTVSVLIIPSYIAPGKQIILAPDPAVTLTIDQTTLEQANLIINERIKTQDVLGWPRAIIDGQTILVTGLYVARDAAFIDSLVEQNRIELIDAGVEFPHIDGATEIRTGASADPDRLVYRKLLNDSDFVRAYPSSKENGVELEIALSPEGTTRLKDFLTQHHGIYLCLVQDDIIIGCPIVGLNETRLTIRQGPTDFLIDESTLAAKINAASLPFPLTILESQ